MQILWTADVANTGTTPTLDAGCGAKSVKTQENAAPSVGLIGVASVNRLTYDGTVWRLPVIVGSATGGTATSTLTVKNTVLNADGSIQGTNIATPSGATGTTPKLYPKGGQWCQYDGTTEKCGLGGGTIPSTGIVVSNGTAFQTSLTTTSGLQGVTFTAGVPALTALGTAATVNTGTGGATVPLLNGANTWSGINNFSVALDVFHAPTASNCTGSALANCGTLSIGGGPFDGSTTGKFVGSTSGTSIAVNEASGYVGDLMNLQVGGVSRFQLSAAGNITGIANVTFGTTIGAYPATGLQLGSGMPFQFTSSSSVGGGSDTSLSRDSAGVIDFGTGAQGSTAGNWKATAGATLAVATSALKTCTATTGTPWRAAVNDATAPAIGVALTGGGTVFALVHCSLTTGTYIVDGI